ncbi:hypothetical protein [Mesorhizobium sp. A623]
MREHSIHLENQTFLVTETIDAVGRVTGDVRKWVGGVFQAGWEIQWRDIGIVPDADKNQVRSALTEMLQAA